MWTEKDHPGPTGQEQVRHGIAVGEAQKSLTPSGRSEGQDTLSLANTSISVLALRWA